jgi:phosphatidylinositol glycan class V
VSLNLIFFTKAANALYELGRKVLRDQRKAEIAAILFCFNPASIFFTAPYSESLYCWLSFTLMIKCFDDINSVFIVLPLSLSILCRSNGLLNIGFVVFYGLKKMFDQNTILSFVTVFLKVFSILIIIAFHFGLMQVYNYYLFCFQKNFNFPAYIKDFALENDLVLAGNRTNDSISPWCLNNLPIAYSYVQEQYWNVGFLKYYEWKQLPNFLLATPIILIILVNSVRFFLKNQAYCCRLGIFNLKPSILRITHVADQNQFVFVVHAFVLCIFCTLFIHIQVTTRILSSANPMIYFFSASYFMKPPSNYKKNDDTKFNEIIPMNIFDIKRLNRTQKLIVYYFLCYYSLGTVLFSNNLPWT